MATGPHLADEKVDFDPSSPDTLCPEPTQYDCEAAADQPASKRSATWRSRLGRNEPENIQDVHETITRQLEECPKGYPRLAAFMSSEDSFGCYRGFGYLHSRVLLSLQDQIVALERELDQKDYFDQQNRRNRRLESRARDEREALREGDSRPREQIIEDIRTKLVQYDEILVKARELIAFQKPSQRDYTSVRNWIRNIKPVVEKEEAFIKHKEDVITLHSGREWSGFDGLVESLLLKLDCKLIRYIFLTPELRVKTVDNHVHYFTRARVDIFVSLVITCVIFVLLVLPVIAMYRLTSISKSINATFNAIGVLVVFTLLFSAAMSLLTKARRHELFAASAAYCAVLVVFISGFSNPSGSSGSSNPSGPGGS